MEKLMIFPWNNDAQVLIDNREKCNKFEIVALSSYLEDEKTLKVMNDTYNILCSSDFELCLKRADSVLFIENTMGHENLGYEQRIKTSLKAKKNVYISAVFLKKLQLCIEDDHLHLLQEDIMEEWQEHLYHINIPIISVMGVGENTGKFDVQAKIRKMVEKQGYKVLCVCSNILGKFIDMEVMPGFLYSDNISLPHKIQMFNSWLYQMYKSQNADLILLGCPGGILEFDEYESNFYGEISSVVSHAVSIDNSMLTLYRNSSQDDESIQQLQTFCHAKYNTDITCFIVARQIFKVNDERKRIEYYCFEKPEVMDKLKIYEEKQWRLALIEEEKRINYQVNQILDELKNNIYAI